MPDKADDIQRLVERIEGASGPDRELDCLIWGAQEGRSLAWQGNLLVEKLEGCIGWVDPGEFQRNFTCNRRDDGAGCIPAYTASIDAAMTLVPSEFYMGRLHQWVADNFRWACDLARKDMTGGKRISAEDCATPALAIAAAALRARITERTNHE